MTPPTVTNLQRFGVHLESTPRSVLTFQRADGRQTGKDLRNYTLVATIHGRDRVIRLLVANYDAVTRTVDTRPRVSRSTCTSFTDSRSTACRRVG